MQFYPKDGSQLDGARLNEVGNDLAAYLQRKFSKFDIIVDRDKDFEDKLSAIGFILPLDSLSQYIMKYIIGGNVPKAEAGDEDLPDTVDEK
jgi:hypothetical protein